jgi:PAS domain S-box-containing protein
MNIIASSTRDASRRVVAWSVGPVAAIATILTYETLVVAGFQPVRPEFALLLAVLAGACFSGWTSGVVTVALSVTYYAIHVYLAGDPDGRASDSWHALRWAIAGGATISLVEFAGHRRLRLRGSVPFRATAEPFAVGSADAAGGGDDAAASRQRLLDLIAGIDAVVWEADPFTWEFFYVSDRCQQILGVPRRVLMEGGGQAFLDLIHPDDRERTVATCRAATERGEPHEMEFRLHRPGEEGETWVRDIVQVQLGEHGRPIRSYGVIVEATSQRRVEAELRESRRVLADLLDRVSDAFVSVDERWRIQYVSELAAKFGGRPTAELLGVSFWDAFPGLDRGGFRQQCLDAFASQTPITIESIGPTTGRWFETSVYPRPDGATLLARDIHDRKLAERNLAEQQAELRRLNQTLEERVREGTAVAEQRTQQLRKLAAELTQAEQRERRRLAQTLHDHLQQLLVAAKLRVNMLAARHRGDPADQPLREVDDLIAQSIDMSRSLTVQLSPPILYDGGLVPAMQWLARWMGEKHGLTVEVAVDPAAEPESQEIKVLLFEAIRELLFNVTKHAGTDRASLEMTRLDPDAARIVVADGGVGFDPAAMSSDGDPASGIGLLSVRERIEFLGGTFEVRSRPGDGTRMIITVPRFAMAASAPSHFTTKLAGQPGDDACTYARYDRRGADTGTIRVLLADDHRILRQGLASLLEEEPGIEVIAEADDGAMAVELAMKTRPDVVVMDITMPRMSGIEATRRITDALPDTAVIGLSMHNESDMASAIREAGAVQYLTKGGPSEDLVSAIRDAAASG